MNFRIFVSAAFIVALPVTVAVAGQHEGHQAGAASQPAAGAVAQCVQAQRSIAATLDAASARLEAARQTNSPAAMRAAIDDLQAALRDVRMRLGPCAAMGAGAAVDPHAGHSMPAPTQK
jgi:hypothetical protein